MARNDPKPTFGGVHRPVSRDTSHAHSLGQARDRAGYDNAPVTGASCLLVAGVLGATLIGSITATVQVIA